MQRLPAITHDWFSLFRVRSPLLTESLLFSLPVGTEMFHFPTFPLPALYIQAGVTRSSLAGFPHSEILGSGPAYRLPEAYRRLLRPSSAPIAKASTVCSLKLDTLFLFDLDKSRSDALRPLCSSQITGGLHAPGLPVAKSQKAQKVYKNLYGPRLSSDPRGPNSVLIKTSIKSVPTLAGVLVK